MSDRVSVGVIGTSWWADLMHLPSLKSHPGAQIAAICGRNSDRAQEMAAKYEIPRVFTDYREMIAQASLDAVVIATPPDLHYPMTMAALDAGLHVMCEKPMAVNAHQAREMYQVAEAAGVVHMIHFTWRWTPYSQYVKTLIDGGAIGRSFHCHIRYLAGHGRRARYQWNWDRTRANGILGGFGSHMIDLARWYVGDIARVSAHLGVFVERPGPEGGPLDPANDSAALLLQFENGAQGMIHVSAVTHTADRNQEQYVALHGEAGTLEVEAVFGSPEEGVVIRGVRSNQDQFEILPVPDDLWDDVDRGDFFSSLLALFVTQPIGDRLFIDTILAGRPPSPSFYDGLRAQETIDAAIESHQSGMWVSVG